MRVPIAHLSACCMIATTIAGCNGLISGGKDQLDPNLVTLDCPAPSAELQTGLDLYGQKCSSCHGQITSSSIKKDHQTLDGVRAAMGLGDPKDKVDQMDGLSTELTDDDISKILAALVPGAFACVPLQATNFSRSSTEVMQTRVQRLFPQADLSSMTDPANSLGQSLGLPDFVSAFSVVQPDSAAAQASFMKNVSANVCANASTTSTMFSTASILMSGEALPTDSTGATDTDATMAFAVARNVWLVPYTADSKEVQALSSLIKSMKADGAAQAEIQQALCLAALAAPQFWNGNPGKFETIKRVALDIGGRAPTFAEFDAFNNGSLTLLDFVTRVQSEPGYLTNVKLWHRNWLGVMDHTKDGASIRGNKYWWGKDGATLWGAQRFEPAVSTGGSLDQTIPIINQGQQNSSEISNSDSCQPFEQTFNPHTERIQWEQKVSGTWYIVGGSKLVGGAWQKFGGSVPVNGTATATTLADVKQAAKNAEQTGFVYNSGALHNLAPFQPTDRRVRRFTKPDDVAATATSANEQNGYSKVKLWWSGSPVYICNAYYRFIQTCGYRPATYDEAFASTNWTADVGKMPMRMGGSIYVGPDGLAHPDVLKDVQCTIGVSDTQGLTFSSSGTANDIVINGDLSPNGAGPSAAALGGTQWQKYYPSMVSEIAAIKSIAQDMRDEPLNLAADIVASNLDYRLLLTADYTFARGPLELYYRSQAHYLATFPPGTTRKPGSSGYMDVAKFSPKDFGHIPRNFFQNSKGGEVVGGQGFFTAQNDGAAPSAIDDPKASDLAPRPISGVLTQNGFLDGALPKMRTISAKILRTFTCGEVNSFAPTDDQGAMQVAYIPIHEKSGEQHVDPKGACYACHINMDPLASALSAGYLMTTDPRTGKPILNGSEYISAYGEIAPFATDDILGGFRYGVRGNSDMPSKGALFGTQVTGVRGVGETLANSDMFAACVVQQAFTAVLNRPPAIPEDQPLLDAVKKDFVDSNYNYNKLIQLLVTSDQFQVRN